MPEKVILVLKRYVAAAVAAAGFCAATALAFLGLIAVTGCFIECSEADVHPEGGLLFLAAIVVVLLALTAAALLASTDRYLARAATAAGWLLAHGMLLLAAAGTDLVDAAYLDIDLQVMVVVSGVVGAILIVARAAVIPAVVAWMLVIVASLVWMDTIVAVSLVLTVVALSIPRGQRYSAA